MPKTRTVTSRGPGLPFVLALFLLSGFNFNLAAQTVSPAELFSKELAGMNKLESPSGMLGENINPQTGSISFTQTDVSLEGNGPPIVVTRAFDSQSSAAIYYYNHYKKFADWKLEIPRIKTTDFDTEGLGSGEYIPDGEWKVTGANPYARCSSYKNSVNIWGMQLEVPGSGAQEILVRSPENTITPTLSIGGVPLAFPLVTNQGWAFSCLANAVKNGKPGEAFLAVAPDGTKYWFDWMTFDYVGPWRIFAPAIPYRMLEASLLVTRVEDRFGNYVLYDYEGDRLIRVTANDGRDLKFVWTADKKLAPDNIPRRYISQIIAEPDSLAPRTWTYDYSSNNSHWMLTTITLPDESKWILDIGNLKVPTMNIPSGSVYQPSYQLLPPAKITTPSGLVAAYSLRMGPVGRSGVSVAFLGDITRFSAGKLAVKNYSGPGVDLTWTYSYVTQFPFDVPVLEAQLRTKNPDGTLQVTIVDNFAGSGSGSMPTNPLEGRLVRREWYAPDEVTLMRQENYEYAQNAGPYPQKFGASKSGVGRARKESLWPVRKIITTQDGVVFNMTVNAYDVFARPVSVTRSSSIAP